MAIGQEMNVYELLGSELKQIASLLDEEEDFRLIVEAPVVGKEVREKIIEAICQTAGFHDITLRFLKLLNAKGRLPHLKNIAGAYEELLDEAQGRVRASVTSASPLSSDAEARVLDALKKITGKDVVMTVDVDDSLIGGVVTRVMGKLFDGSVRTQLQTIEERFKAAGGLEG
jgi:F-type H+-transporting ATPase subunit delta